MTVRIRAVIRGPSSGGRGPASASPNQIVGEVIIEDMGAAARRFDPPTRAAGAAPRRRVSIGSGHPLAGTALALSIQRLMLAYFSNRLDASGLGPWKPRGVNHLACRCRSSKGWDLSLCG